MADLTRKQRSTRSHHPGPAEAERSRLGRPPRAGAPAIRRRELLLTDDEDARYQAAMEAGGYQSSAQLLRDAVNQLVMDFQDDPVFEDFSTG